MDKTCRVCHIPKPLDAYTKSAKSVDGHDTICRACAVEWRRQRAGAAPKPVTASAPVTGLALTKPAQDFRPNREVLATFAAIQAIVSDGGTGPNMLWVGPSGSGKTEAARDLARRSGLPFYKIDAPAMTDPEAWFGTREVVVEDGAPKTVYRESQFVTGLGEPCVMLIDEGNRVADAVRMIMLPLWDDSRAVTNPLTGQPVVRHPECYMIMTANVGLAFTGTYAIDPAFYTRAVTTKFSYLEAADEEAVARTRTGVDSATAALLVRFANESRTRHAMNEDFPPVSTREVLTASALVARGLDVNTAAHQAIINSAPSDGGAESIQGQLELIWTGIRQRAERDEAIVASVAATETKFGYLPGAP